MQETILFMKDIVKEFPGVIAVNHVSLELKRGEVLALVGENGAGKSTLIKVLSGALTPDRGEVIVDGKKIEQFNPRYCLERGIRVLYQELNNFDTISIAENIFAGHIPVKGKLNLTDKPTMYRKSEELLKQCGLEVYPGTPVSRLSVAQKQLVEIAKALSGNTTVLVMDEPTAALNEKEVENLFSIINRMKENGTAIIYISHRLDEIFQVADRVQIMRDGKSVRVSDINTISKQQIVADMVGQELGEAKKERHKENGEIILETQNLAAHGFHASSIRLHRGETIALYGLMGAGQNEYLEALFGIRQVDSGSICVKGKTIVRMTPSKAIKSGIGYVPNERKRDGLYLKLGIDENIVITCLKKILNHRLVSYRKVKDLARHWISELNIKTVSEQKKAGSLSGGNQQKIVIAKWLATDPDVLLLNEPTRGVDVGAKAEIYHIIEEMLKQGKGVIVVSSDLPEILTVADRVYVFCDGDLIREFDHDEISPHALLECALGGEG